MMDPGYWNQWGTRDRLWVPGQEGLSQAGLVGHCCSPTPIMRVRVRAHSGMGSQATEQPGTPPVGLGLSYSHIIILVPEQGT